MYSPANLSYLVLGAAPHHNSVGIYLAIFPFLLLFFSVVLPAVWSSKPARRAAAITVLAHILNALRGPAPDAHTQSAEFRALSVSSGTRTTAAPNLVVDYDSGTFNEDRR